MACPFFVPSIRFDGGPWQHPARLPLGAGWRGSCSANSSEPPDHVVAEQCNLGYAKCPQLPDNREADAVRFSVAAVSDMRIRLNYVLERGHRPVRNGVLEFSRPERKWIVEHPNAQVQRMAVCYVEVYLARIRPS